MARSLSCGGRREAQPEVAVSRYVPHPAELPATLPQWERGESWAWSRDHPGPGRGLTPSPSPAMNGPKRRNGKRDAGMSVAHRPQRERNLLPGEKMPLAADEGRRDSRAWAGEDRAAVSRYVPCVIHRRGNAAGAEPVPLAPSAIGGFVGPERCPVIRIGSLQTGQGRLHHLDLLEALREPPRRSRQLVGRPSRGNFSEDVAERNLVDLR